MYFLTYVTHLHFFTNSVVGFEVFRYEYSVMFVWMFFPAGLPGKPGESGPAGPPGPKGESGGSTGGVVYSRWGRKHCPQTSGTSELYSGINLQLIDNRKFY